MTDQIADMIIRIKNASTSKKESVSFPYSNLKLSILDVLQKEGFIKSFEKKGKKVIKFLDVSLLYSVDGEARVHDVERVSKSSKRVYYPYKELRPVKSGHGILVLSTPKGVMSDKQAKAEKVGGEALFKIW
jgi:small subunit ribosomal protein S8